MARITFQKSCHIPTDSTETASFELAMCYLNGFGVNVDPQRSCELVLDACRRNDSRAFQICRRLHEGFCLPFNWGAPGKHPIWEVEDNLQVTPPALYCSLRIRRHERAAQIALIKSTADIFTGEILVAEKVTLGDLDAIGRVISVNASKFLCFVQYHLISRTRLLRLCLTFLHIWATFALSSHLSRAA